MRLQLGCCCEPPPTTDPCTGCLDVDLLNSVSAETIQLDFEGMSWPLSENGSCTDTWSDGFGITFQWDWQTRTHDIANLNGGISLRRKIAEPAGWTPVGGLTPYPARICVFESLDGCQWLYEDLTGINDKVRIFYDPHPATSAERVTIHEYTPENPDDPGNPWYAEREIQTPLPDCAFASEWACAHHIFGNGVTLEFRVGSDSSPTGTGATLWWWLKVWAVPAWHFIQTGNGNAVRVRGFGGGSKQLYAAPAVDPTGICAEICDGTTLLTFGAVLTYAKKVNCATDFEGDPITLNLHTLYQDRADAIGITYPSTCQLTI